MIFLCYIYRGFSPRWSGFPGNPEDPDPHIARIAAVSPAMINLLTRARLSCLLFQNQTENNEERKAGNSILCLRL